jgi:tetratricopeptide (TPR) repeat protein
LPEAERLYRAALKSDGRHFGALYSLGVLKLQQGQMADAERWLGRALRIDPNSAETHHHLGIVLAGLQRSEEAIKHYETALDINPGLAETHNNLGHALQWLGRLDEAKEHYERALAIKPAYAEARNNFGNVLHLLGQSERAVVQYEHALALDPRYGEVHTNFGNVLTKLGQFEKAMEHYRKALAINPRDVESHYCLAATLDLVGHVEEALSHWDAAIAIDPGYAAAHLGRGRALQALGRLQEGIASFEKAVALAPQDTTAYLELTKARRFKEADPQFKAMLGLASNVDSLPEPQKIELHFAMGKAFADVGNYQESSRHLLRGNWHKRQLVTYDEQRLMRRIERTRAVFTPELMREKQGLGDPSPVPVFIIGLPRSGTTLIEQILASHPKVFGADEVLELANVSGMIIERSGREFPEGIPGLSGEELREFGAIYLRGLRRLAPEAERITDKMHTNFLLAGLIPLVLPNARIIHCCRDVRDTALSCFFTLFAVGQEHTYDLAELGRYIRAYQTLMEHWRKVLPAGTMLDVQYEDVVDNLEDNARRIVAHCGLEWDEACLAFHQTNRAVRTPSANQVRQPIYQSSVGRWRAYEQLLHPLLQELDAPGSAS